MKKFVSSLIVAATYFAYPVLAFADTAVNPCSTGNSGAVFNPLCLLGTDATGKRSIGGVLGLVITLLFVVAIIVALFFLVQGGIKWITSQGDTKNVEGARNQIIAAAVGLAFTFLSYLIINLMLQFFLGKSIQDIQLPTLS